MKKRLLTIYFVLIALVSLSTVSCKQVVKPLTKSAMKTIEKSGAKSAEKSVIKNGGKEAIKVMSKGVLKEVPVGKESLKVIVKPNGVVEPAINNLGKQSVKYSDEFNNIIFKERRKSITYDYQFISPEDLKKTVPKNNLTEKSNPVKLRKNMYERMGPEKANVAKAFGGTEAHHVVEGNDVAAKKSREILKKYNIGINDAENGVLLRSDDASIYKGALHNTSHSQDYSDYVYSKIRNVKSREELVLKLSEIKKELVDGTIDLTGKKNLKNTLIF